MKLPKGWVFIPRMKNRATIEIEQRELITCADCTYYGTTDCKWREDESPEPDDYCSIAEEIQ